MNNKNVNSSEGLETGTSMKADPNTSLSPPTPEDTDIKPNQNEITKAKLQLLYTQIRKKKAANIKSGQALCCPAEHPRIVPGILLHP